MPETEETQVTEQTEAETEQVVEETTEPESSEASDETVDINKDDYNLLLLLKNPDTRTATIQALLQHEGVKDEPRQTETKSSKSLADEIKEVMGEDFDQVPAKLWPAIDKLLDLKVQNVQNRIEQTQRFQIEREATEATERLYKKFNDVAKYEKDMSALMQKYSPAQNQSQYDYLQDMYDLAKSKKSSSPTAQSKINARIRQNSREVDISSNGADERNIRTGSKKFISAREAVELALRGKKVE